MRRLSTLFALSLLSGFACAGSPEYLKLRKQYGVTQAVGLTAINAVKGSKVLELQGQLKGSCRTGDVTTLIIALMNDETQEIEAKAVPEWLIESTKPLRFLVRCDASAEGTRVRLINVAPEIDVLPVEEAYWRGLAAKRAALVAKPPASRSATTTTRGNLRGPIGRPHAEWILPASKVTPIYASFIRGQNRRLTSTEAMQIAELVVGFSMRYGIDARLVMSMLIVESGFDPNAVSRSGAVGLGQLMPGTAKWMGVDNSFDPTQNLYGSVKLLRRHLDQYRGEGGRALSLTLAAYNAGAGAVKRHGGIPPYRETQAYVRKVTAIYAKLCGY